MMWRTLALAVACTGCGLVPESVDVSGSGVATGVSSQRIQCSASGTLERYLAGSGHVAITVADGTLAPAYNGSTDVDGEIDNADDVDGTPGSWKLAVDAQGFAGQWKITLTCP